VSPVKPPFIRNWWISFDLNDGLEFRKFVLDEENSFEKVLVLHHDDVGLRVQGLLRDLIGAQDVGLADRDGSEEFLIIENMDCYKRVYF